MNLGITGLLYGLRRSGALPQYQGALPQPRAGVENAMIAWAQPRRPTIVNSNRFFPWYIQLSGGNRVNIRENRTGINMETHSFKVEFTIYVYNPRLVGKVTHSKLFQSP